MKEKFLQKYESKIQRFFEIIPGFLTWLVLTSPIWLGRPLPLVAAFFLTFLVLFWVYRAVIHIIGLFVGYRRYKKELQIDWVEKLKLLGENSFTTKHLILVPVASEKYQVLKETVTAIANQTYPKDKIYLLLSIEERGGEELLRDIKQLKEELKGKIPNFWFSLHPAGLPSEVVGAAANRTWGAKDAAARLEKQGENLDNFLLTTFDADGIIHPQFLSRLTYEYLTTKGRENHFYQTAVHLYDNNLWQVPPLMRIQANSVTLAVLSSWTFEAHLKDTWSCFSIALTTLINVNYWDVTLGIDDTPFFWRAFFKKKGDFSGRTFYIPISSDAVQGKGFLDSHVSQYKQLLRWGWGVIVFPIAMRGFLTIPEIPFRQKLLQVFKMIEQYTIWRTITFLLTFGFPLLLFFNPKLRTTALGYNLPRLTGYILTLALVFLLPATAIREKIVKEKPKDWPWWKKVLTYLEGPLVIVNLLTYVFVPYVDAETRMMLGRKFEFKTTPKIRQNKKH
ncbi:MAG: glycosyltransferase family 2 protein [Candidatus Cloacimonetes bacterium]|nr:glycosyltransferase family 2 protein [Candidatus Cloacimonadota bacterium]